MMTFDIANILTSLIFIKRAICGSNITILTDDTPTIKLHVRF